MSDRQRRASMARAQKLLPDAQVRGYVIGRAGSHPVLVVGAILGAFFLLAIATLVATGGFVVPGALMILLVQHFASPPRGLAVCDRGVAVVKRSLLNSKPAAVVCRSDLASVAPVDHRIGRTQVAAGGETLWLTKNEEALLRASITAARQGGPVLAAS